MTIRALMNVPAPDRERREGSLLCCDRYSLNPPRGAQFDRMPSALIPVAPVRVWDWLSEHVATPVDEGTPAVGSQTVVWGRKDTTGHDLGPGYFIVRVTVDGRSESQLIHLV